MLGDVSESFSARDVIGTPGDKDTSTPHNSAHED